MVINNFFIVCVNFVQPGICCQSLFQEFYFEIYLYIFRIYLQQFNLPKFLSSMHPKFYLIYMLYYLHLKEI